MTLSELATRISAHLKCFENDPEINKREAPNRLLPYWHARAYGNGTRGIRVRYISFQNGSRLTRAEAARYLAWLDAGNIGKHYAMPDEEQHEPA